MCEQGKFVCDDGSPIMGHDSEAQKDVDELIVQLSAYDIDVSHWH